MENLNSKDASSNAPAARLEPVHECWSDGEAGIIVSFLAAHGIRALIRTEVPHSVLPVTVDGLGKVQIYVARSDAARARDLLQSVEASLDSETPPAADGM